MRKISFRCQQYENGWKKFPSTRVKVRAETWNLGYTFATLQQAVAAMEAWIAQSPILRGSKYYYYRVVDEEEQEHVVWEYLSSFTIPQEEKNVDDTGKAPLHIERVALIEALEVRLSEEQMKRREAEDKRTESREAVLEAVSNLTADQIANIIHQHIVRATGNDAIEEWVNSVVEEEKYVSQELKPSYEETALEKYVRVLKLAKDEEIEVEPTDPIYPLL